MQAFVAELLKNKHSRIVAVTFIAFALAPLMGGVLYADNKKSRRNG